MRHSKVLAKLRAGKVARICCCGSPIAFFPAMAAHFHYDGIWLDGEHRAWEAREIETMLGRHHAADIDCMWRPPTKRKKRPLPPPRRRRRRIDDPTRRHRR
jgi:4-hydroxy-2-oxoheptanedioate aldolase